MQTGFSSPSAIPQPAQALTFSPPASFGRRFGALVLDWILLFFLVPGTAMLVAIADEALSFSNTISNTIFLSLTVALVVGGFTISYRLGATPGMLALSTRIVDAATSKHIGWIRAFIRAIAASLLVASWFWVFNVFIFSDARVEGSTTVDVVLDYGALAVLLTSIFGRLWILVDQHDQTLFDHVLRVQAIRKPARHE
jgi:uncharacterized RDD family membrane protein YckC